MISKNDAEVLLKNSNITPEVKKCLEKGLPHFYELNDLIKKKFNLDEGEVADKILETKLTENTVKHMDNYMSNGYSFINFLNEMFWLTLDEMKIDYEKTKDREVFFREFLILCTPKTL